MTSVKRQKAEIYELGSVTILTLFLPRDGAFDLLGFSNAKRVFDLAVNSFWRGFRGRSRPLKRGVWGATTQAKSLYSNRSTQSKTCVYTVEQRGKGKNQLKPLM
jgi:hypothetical protein